MSTYIPHWVKKNNKRFPRAKIRDENGALQIIEVLSVFDAENVKADSTAFERLMGHLKDVDSLIGTVIMVQVENEVGLLGGSRDLARPALKAFSKPVPTELVHALTTRYDTLHPVLRDNLDRSKLTAGSTWRQVFGDTRHADEIYMAYHYAIYVEKVAQSGKAIYPVPMFTNAWLSSVDKDDSVQVPNMAGGGENPGEWPCGGPNIGVLDIWMIFAPSLDFFSPDVYLHHYSKVIETWRHNGQALFVPEQRRDELGLGWMWEAFGSHGALAASPFGIDTIEGAEREAVRKHFGLLSKLQHYILQSQQCPGNCHGFWFDKPIAGETILSNTKSARFGTWEITIKRAFVPGRLASAYGAIFPLGPNKFLIAGEGYQLHFRQEDALFSGIIAFDEMIMVNATTGEMKTGRRFNGDETVGGKCIVMPSEVPDQGGFPIAIFIPAGSKIAQVEVYSLFDE